MATTSTPKVPVCLTGLVVKLTGPDFCMDGATHLLQNIGVHMRMIARNAQVAAAMKKAQGKRMNFTACGYLIRGPECSHLSVYSLEPSASFEKRLDAIEQGQSMFE